ncbi:hypothetical protein L1887_16465 [Cichorium endivia]|nr:hypothetical protein L1887_16465 [Cichorium endivia]
MASSSNAKDFNAEDFDEEDDTDYDPSSDESTEFSDDDFGSDMSGVSLDLDENEYVPSKMDKTLVDPFLNDLVQDEIKLPEISSNDEEWSPSNEYNDKGDSEDQETGFQFIGLLEAIKEIQDTVLETQDTVPETQFKQVHVVDVALVEAGNKEDQGHVVDVPVIHKKLKPRRPSERILKNKLKNPVFDKDGGGSTNENTVDFE